MVTLETVPRACPFGSGFPQPANGEAGRFLGVAYASAFISCEAVKQTAANGGYASKLQKTWEGLRIGWLDPEKWFFSAQVAPPNSEAHEQICKETRMAYSELEKLADRCESVELITGNNLKTVNGLGVFDLIAADFRDDLESYLSSLTYSKVRTLSEIIQYNKDNASEALPIGYEGQDLLIAANDNQMTPTERLDVLSHVRRLSRQGIDGVLEGHGVDVIIGPADSGIHLLACASGYPCATMPLSYLEFNGRPFGLVALATAHGEGTLMKVLSAWEATFPARKPPRGY